jgi:hypothetical protein
MGSIPNEVVESFKWPNPSSRIMFLGLTLPLTEMSTRNPSGGEGQLMHKANNLKYIFLWANCLENVGASMSHNPTSLHGLLQGQLYLIGLPKLCDTETP